MTTQSSSYEYSQGNYVGALRLCEAIYTKDPSDTENLLILSACHLQLSNIQESRFYAQQCIGVDPNLAQGFVAVGRCFVELGEFQLAMDIFKMAIRIQPRFANAFAELGCLHLKQKRLKEAIGCLETAISLNPNLAEAAANLAHALSLTGDLEAAQKVLKSSKVQSAMLLIQQGIMHQNTGNYDNAIRYYSKALKLEPSFYDAEINLCGCLVEKYKTTRESDILTNAVTRLERLLKDSNVIASSHSLLGICQALLGNNQSAIKHLYAAMLLEPQNDAATSCNLGGLLLKEGCLQRVTALCYRTLQTNPNCYQAMSLLGLITFQLSNYELADRCFRAAHMSKPSSFNNVYMGAVLLQKGKVKHAARLFKNAIASDPHMSAAFLNLGNAHFESGNNGAAEKCYQTCIESKADCASVASINHMMMHLSQSNIDSAAEIAQRLQEMFCQNATLSQEVQLVNAYSCVWHKSSDMSTPYNKRTHDATWRIRTPFSNPPMPKQRIKIAYVSSGFGNHATGFLTHSIFAHHDKSRFDVIAISLSPCDASSEWTQMESNVDKLLCIGKEINSEDLCSMIRDDGIHILVDLDGYTLDSRPELFAWRAAPIQISMCSAGPPSGIDYVVADKYSLPSGMLPHYSEKVLYVPHFPNSYTQTESCGIDFDEIDRYKIREEYGIPEESLVYACFAQPYKITPDVFAAWMNILNAVPNSQLILIRYSQVMERNLRKEIAKYSIAQDRVLFWDLVPRREHMVRSCIVDVVLDTISSGVAASYDAIWTNTPLVTMAGENMMSRLGASVLNYLGLEQLIASDLERYIQIAVSLSDDEDKYMDTIRMLEDSRDNGDLFDCKLWVASFEKELEKCIHKLFHPDR